MAMHHYQKGFTKLGPRLAAVIETVNPSEHLIQGRLKDRGVIYITTGGVPSTFVWPKQGEYWYVRQENHHWRLDTKVDLKTDFTIDQLQPGESRIAADEIYDANKKHIVAVDDSNAVNNNIIIYNNNQWIVSSLSLNRYYGAFSDYTNQYGGGGASPGVANTAAPFTFDTTDENNGVSIVDNSKITFAHAGTYNVQWSGQFECTSNSDQDVSVWLRKNGVNPGVVGSTGLISIPSSRGAIHGHIINGWNFVFTVAAGDYYEFMWSTSSNKVSVQTYPIDTSPARPSTASLVLTVTPVR
jgi:hypothetical protein